MKKWSTGSPDEMLTAALREYWINKMIRVKEARIARGEK